MLSASHIRAIGALTSMLRSAAGRIALSLSMVTLLVGVGYGIHSTTVVTPTLQIMQTAGKNGSAELYPIIFAAQEKGDFAAADVLIAQLNDTSLMGYVLAQRYQNAHYHATAGELLRWLSQYADHPQAKVLYNMAVRSGASNEALSRIQLPQEATLRGEGGATQLGRTTMPDLWYVGLRFYKEGNYWKAALPFTAIARDDRYNPWQRSAGAYWAYRSLKMTGNQWDANRFLSQAASFPNTFYGMLANAQQGRGLAISAAYPRVPEALWSNAGVRRAAMLVAIDRSSEAEAELRTCYSTLGTKERAALISIAARLNLPNLQLRLSQQPDLKANEALTARYPMPPAMVEAQSVTDPALILAVARHESAFRETVRSGSGAVGMMQMLPSTAQHVLAASDDLSLAMADNSSEGSVSVHDRLNDMTMSAKLGGAYFTMLAQQPAVGNNLMRLLAAYNAGPGTVANWQKTAAKNITDPLLYMEMIPYPETHNYVVQVMTNYWIYQGLMGKNPTSLKQLTNGEWPTLG